MYLSLRPRAGAGALRVPLALDGLLRAAVGDLYIIAIISYNIYTSIIYTYMYIYIYIYTTTNNY